MLGIDGEEHSQSGETQDTQVEKDKAGGGALWKCRKLWFSQCIVEH